MSGLTQVSSRGRAVLSARDRKRNLKAEFEKVALPQLSRLYAAAFYFTKDKSEAEDLVQETYLRAFSFFEQFEPGTNCRAWLLSVMRNLFINRYRQRQREPESMDWEKVERNYEMMIAGEEKGNRENPETLVFSKVTRAEITKALQELPEEFRTAIVLVDIQELTYEETAKVMECPIGTVRSRVSRGRRLLQVALRDCALEHGLMKKSIAEEPVTSMTG